MDLDLTSILDPDEVPSEWWHERMRIQRNRLLQESDWTQLSDSSCDTQAWAKYRQALRDFPISWVAGPSANFPDKP